ncbi:MAG: beta-propeller fold lactonase family protein [Acidimicrobiia bacterium]|nr:beta-propeller fold lactonase family protein [Acidimicrobiia bacterium]
MAPPLNLYAEARAGKLAPAVADVPARAYVPGAEDHTVSVIDAASFEPLERLTVDRGPQHVVPSWDLSQLWVLSTEADTITPLDPRTGEAGPKVSVTDPHNLYFTPDGTTAIVLAPAQQRLDLYDPLTWQLQGTVAIRHAGITHGDLSDSGRFFYAGAEQSGWVVKVDLQERRVSAEAQVGALPVDVRLAPDATVLYVADAGRHGVALLDPVDLREITFLPTGRGAHALQLSRDTTKLYVSNRLEGSVSVVDLTSQEVVATWRVPGGSPDAGGVSADGTQLWLAGPFHDEVYVLDTTTGQLIRRIATGAAPHAVTVFPQPGRFSLGHTGIYR